MAFGLLVGGEVVVEPDTGTCEYFDAMARQLVAAGEKLGGLRDLPAVTPDGHRVRLMANIELAEEIPAQGRPFSLNLTLPPLSGLFLKRQD